MSFPSIYQNLTMFSKCTQTNKHGCYTFPQHSCRAANYGFEVTQSDNFILKKKNLQVICKQLNLGRKGQAYFNIDVPESSPFWLKEVHCRGGETSISLCENSGYGSVRGCMTNSAAGVICYNDGNFWKYVVGNNSVINNEHYITIIRSC